MKNSNHHDWYLQAFNYRYLELYSHRDENELHQLYDTLVRFGLFPTNGQILDAACGAGRWLRYLLQNGLNAIGFDLSDALLSQCRELPVIRADMRSLPFENESFTSVHSLFSSFGYFDDIRDDYRQIQEFVRVLKKNGWLLLDTLPPRYLQNLPPDNTFRFSDKVVAFIHRESRLNVIYKTVRLDNGEMWEERLRVYTPSELDQLLSEHNCSLLWRIGHYDGSPYSENESPRLISCYVRNSS